MLSAPFCCLLLLLIYDQCVYSSVNRLPSIRHQQLTPLYDQKQPRSTSNGITRDAPFSVNQSAIEATITCLGGTPAGRPGGIVLLVHGTGSTGNDSWEFGPYTQILPNLSPGFDVCYITLPHRSQSDIQVTSEYVAGNIIQLAKKSKTGKICLIGHSQGNINIQWALNFWPSTRPYVQHFVSVAGDFRGTNSVRSFCKIWGKIDLLSGNCTQAYFQQSNPDGGPPSHFLSALNHFGHQALVPTTSIYTKYDDIIKPEKGNNATSMLPGAENILLQHPKICNTSHFAEHFMMLYDPGAFALAYGGLRQAPGTVPNNWNPSYCLQYIGKGVVGTVSTVAGNFKGSIKAIINNTASISTYSIAKNETKLLPYVCQSGSAPVEQCQ